MVDSCGSANSNSLRTYLNKAKHLKLKCQKLFLFSLPEDNVDERESELVNESVTELRRGYLIEM